MICNSLHFKRGSEQELHFDIYCMPPPPEGRLIVTSICLEDVHPNAGPIIYIPGSHKMTPFVGAQGNRTAPDKLNSLKRPPTRTRTLTLKAIGHPSSANKEMYLFGMSSYFTVARRSSTTTGLDGVWSPTTSAPTKFLPVEWCLSETDIGSKSRTHP